MESFWLIVLVGVLLSIFQLAVGVLVGRVWFSSRQKNGAAEARDLQRVRTFTGRLYRLMAGVASDVDRHQVRIQQISSELASVRASAPPAVAEAVRGSVGRLLEVNSELQRRLRTAEEKLDAQAAQINAHALQSRVDPVTGLLNRRAFDEALGGRTAAWQLHGLSFCLMMLDVDQFKPLNDRYGHLAGDMALRHIADALREELTDLDVIARIGGDEFAAILPRSSPSDAQHAAERICGRASSCPLVYHEDEFAVTVSVGLAVVERGEDAVSVMRRADEAMYASKRGGRNRAHFHDGQRCLALEEPRRQSRDAGNVATGGASGGTSSEVPAGMDPEAVRDELRRRLREAVETDRPDSASEPPSPSGSS